MIGIDTSALMAILQGEPDAERCSAILEREERLLRSSAAPAEALIASARRTIDDAVNTLIGALAIEIVPVPAVTARRVAAISAGEKGSIPPASTSATASRTTSRRTRTARCASSARISASPPCGHRIDPVQPPHAAAGVVSAPGWRYLATTRIKSGA